MRLSLLFVAAAMATIPLTVSGHAATVGTNLPTEGVSAARIDALPKGERDAWQAYFERSQAQRAADKQALAVERAGLTAVPPPPGHGHDEGLSLKRDAAWFGSEEARRIADTVVSFQTPAGGWGKNMNFEGAARLPGQAYVPNNTSSFLAADDFDTPHEPDWNYVGTLDNGATTDEMFFLAKVIAAVPGSASDAYRASFVKGVRFLVNAQYPNGGWPQVWPLEGGYHDAVTYNDDAVTLAATVLTEVGANANDAFAFVPPQMRLAARDAAALAQEVVLKTQIRDAQGHLTIWGQQHDALSLEPVTARNYEPALPSTEESAALVDYLMRLPNLSPAIQASIHAAAAFLRRTAIMDREWKKADAQAGRVLVAVPGAGPIWARYYTPDGQPRFGDRDKTLHDDVNELSKERRGGYAWFNTRPAETLKRYEAWAKAHPAR